MQRLFLFCLFLLTIQSSLGAILHAPIPQNSRRAIEKLWEKRNYPVTNDPIDVLIPCAEKDLATLHHAINGIRTFGKNIRRVIVISPKKLTDKAEWFDESKYPFTKADIAAEIFPEMEISAALEKLKPRSGWIIQQLMKFYAHRVIPHLSPNTLMLDADTIFLAPVQFIGPFNEALYTTGSEYNKPYFDHMAKLLPDFKRYFPDTSGVVHHMLMQRPVLDALLLSIESQHQMPAWKAILRCIDRNDPLGASFSEYEIYFNFVMRTATHAKIRYFTWGDFIAEENSSITLAEMLPQVQAQGMTQISCHNFSDYRSGKLSR